MMNNDEITIINRLIATAINCGGDIGGAYFIEMDKLEDVVNDWLKFKNLDSIYKYIEPEYIDCCEISDCIIRK